MKVPFIDFSIQYRGIRKEILGAVKKVFDSQKFILNKSVAALESRIVEKMGAKAAVALASGSDALYLSLWAMGIRPGDEVITTPFTFFATAGSISRLGARPVFVDIDLSTFNLDARKIKSVITKKTKAILPVHLFGLCCDMNPILALAKKYSLFVVEDAAQSLGARYKGKSSGLMGDTGCFSFYPTKNLGGAGDGGMAVSSSPKLAESLRLLRDHGSRKKYIHEIVGTNSRLDEIQAAALLVRLKYLDRWSALRQEHAADYTRGLSGLPIQTPIVPKGYTHIFHLYSILTEKRGKLAAYLMDNGVGTGIYYPLPLHLQPCYESLGYKKGDFPNSEKAASHILSLPMYPELTLKQKNFVIETIRKFFRK